MTIHVQFDVTPTRGRPEELIGHARFLNRGDTPVSFIPIQLDSASLALEIVDSGGDPVPLPPPPVPDPSTPTAELAPNESYQTDYPGFLPAWSPPGEYRVRVRLTGIQSDGGPASDWIPLTVIA